MLKVSENNNNENTLDTSRSISNIKLLILALTGILGLFVFGLIAELIAKSIPSLSGDQVSGVTNFITYAMLLIALVSILNKDILKLKNHFTNWKSYIAGLIIGFLIIGFQLGYVNIVNLFYKFDNSDNEKALRSFITIYPALSIIILCFVGPFCEETTYRLGLFSFFSKNKIVAYIISILIFTLMHFNPASETIINELVCLPMYLLSATLLTVAFDKYGMSASLLAHIVNNLYSVIGILIATNLG